LVPPSDVAAVWPAAGIGAGILLAFGRSALVPLAIGVMVGTVVATVLSDRSLATAVFKGFCYVTEPVIVAWLLARWFGPAFSFQDLRRVSGFLAAAVMAAAITGIGGAATITLLHTTAPFWDAWRAWSLADGVGILVVAPLGNTELNGPAVVLRAEAGQVVAMVVHELATNAAKHGSLSTPNGRVSVRWRRRSNGDPHAPLVLEWRETAGPSVVAPQKTGYGTSIIRDVIPYEFGGTVDLTFTPLGVQCRLELSATWL